MRKRGRPPGKRYPYEIKVRLSEATGRRLEELARKRYKSTRARSDAAVLARNILTRELLVMEDEDEHGEW